MMSCQHIHLLGSPPECVNKQYCSIWRRTGQIDFATEVDVSDIVDISFTIEEIS